MAIYEGQYCQVVGRWLVMWFTNDTENVAAWNWTVFGMQVVNVKLCERQARQGYFCTQLEHRVFSITSVATVFLSIRHCSYLV